jgi:serine/threonine protein phosphatase 1
VTVHAAFIGDIHGQSDQLAEAFERLLPTDRAIVLLGDYVNYGPDSRGVLDFLVTKLASLGDQLVLLSGNHDEAFLAFLNGGDLGSLLALGGAPTVTSYLPEPVGPISDQLRLAVPPEHHVLLSGLQTCWRSPGVIAMHCWPKETVDTSDYLVLGHYLQPGGQPTVAENVAYIDTGCVLSASQAEHRRAM